MSALDAHGALALRILGPFELRRPEGQPLHLPKKAQALLSILAIAQGQPLPKDRLATMLWGDRLTEQAQQSLRQSMVSLRAALGRESPLLVADAGTIALRSSPMIEVDAIEFQRSCQAGVDELEAADRLYRDEILSGLHIEVEAFQRWLEDERHRFLAMRVGMLRNLAGIRAAAGLDDEAISFANRLLELDALQEDGHSLLMFLHARQGNRGAALLQFKECSRVLGEELGIGPDAKTRALAEIIRSGSPLPNGEGTIWASTVPAPHEPQRRTEPSASVSREAAVPYGRPDRISVVVLPFVNLSSDSSQDYFVRGLVEDITLALGQEKWLFIIATSTATAIEKAQDPLAAASSLGVRYVLRGSVRLDAERIVFVTQLVDAQRGGHIWSERFEDRIDNVFSVQDRLTARVAAMITPALLSVEVDRALHKSTGNVSALDLFLQAVGRFRASRSDNAEAIDLLRKAIKLDPEYAAAYALAARCYQFQLMFGWRAPGDPEFQEGIRFAQIAATKGRNDPEALWMAGLALAHLSGEVEYAIALIDRSLALNRNSANAWIAGCLVHSYLGHTQAAIESFEQAQRLNPLDQSQHLHWNTVAWAYLGAGQYREAAEAADRTLLAQPDYLPGLRLAASTHALLGETEKSEAARRRLLEVQPSCNIGWMRAFLELPLSQNRQALDRYLDGARRAGVPERAKISSH